MHVIDKLSMDGVNPSSCTILLGEWIPRLDADGFHTTVLSLRQPDISGKYLEARGIKVFYQGHGKISYKNVNSLMDLMDHNKPHILHLHGYSAANYGRIAARRKRVKNIVHEHAVLKVMPHQYLADLFLRHYTDSAIAVSDSVKRFMIRGRNIPGEKIRVIRNGIKLDRFKRSDAGGIREKRREFGIDDGYSVVGTVTRLRKEKGVEYFVRSIPGILRTFPKTLFVVVGDGPLRNALEQLAVNLGVAKHVRFLGFRSDVPELLSIFDINVIPSLSEGMPLSLVEAMATGNPVVATSVGGLKEVGEDAKTVMFIPPNDANAIAAKVCYLLGNRELCLKLSNNAKISSTNFSVERNVLLLSEFYRTL